MRPGTLFICKRRGGPRIGAPHQIPFGNAISADSAQTVVSGCPDRAMLPKTPFSGNGACVLFGTESNMLWWIANQVRRTKACVQVRSIATRQAENGVW
jgi:hypothetical protein